MTSPTSPTSPVDDGPDELDALIGGPATELLDRAWLAADLVEWLTSPTPAVTADHTRRHPHGPTLDQQVWMLGHLGERIAALLDNDRGQP